MPFRESSLMEEKEQFCKRAMDQGVNFSALCWEFGISRKTGYRVLERYFTEGPLGLLDRSRRPHSSPGRIPTELEERVVRVRMEHPSWGARKLSTYLVGQGIKCPKTTIGRVLKRQGLISSEESSKHRPWKRFQTSGPNEMWQMDFTIFRLLGTEVLAHILVILDDASRYAIRLGAYHNEQRETVEEALKGAFRAYGLPRAILTDNGSPWGSCGSGEGYTKLSVWLIRLDIKLVHSRAYHPQTLGKVERFNRTLKQEARVESFEDLIVSQRALDAYLRVYNFERPHGSLGLKTPGSVYEFSPRPYPERLESIDYDGGYLVRKVGAKGEIYFKNRVYQVGQAFTGLPVGLLAVAEDRYDVYFLRERIAQVSLSPE